MMEQARESESVEESWRAKDEIEIVSFAALLTSQKRALLLDQLFLFTTQSVSHFSLFSTIPSPFPATKMVSWATKTFVFLLLVDTLYVIVVFCAWSFRSEHMRRFEISGNFTVICTNSSNCDTDSGNYPPIEPMLNELRNINAFYALIFFTSITRILVSVLIVRHDVVGDDDFFKILCSHSVNTMISMTLCVALAILFHEDIGNELDRNLNIDSDLIGDRRPRIELIVGIVGAFFNVLSLVLTCGYHPFRDLEARAEARENERMSRIRSRNTDHGNQDMDIESNGNRSDQQLIPD